MPQKDVRPLRAGTSNQDILNAIRKNASPDYQRRIPEATKASVQDSLQRLTDYRPYWNEFTDALINRIGLVLVKNQMWTNPLAKFKRGMLQYGDTIEEINVGLIKSRVYNPEREYLERDIFGNYPPEVQSSFHRVNRQEFYPVSINEPLLQRAFLEDGGLQSFVTSVMQAPATSDQWDEFLLTTSLFREYYNADGFFKVNTPDLSKTSADSSAAKGFLKNLRAMSGTLQFMSTLYNAAGMPIAVSPEDLELFITPEALAVIDVEALAGAFNIDSARMPARITIIPQQNFNIPGAQAILTTKDFFVIADQRIETSSVYNPVSLSNNMFLHHWEVISASRFVPAILYTTEPSTPIVVTDTPVTSISALSVTDASGATVTQVDRGSRYQIVGSAVTTPADGANNALRSAVEGNTSTHTYMTQNGVLYVAPDEQADVLTIRESVVDSKGLPQLDATTTVQVTGPLAILWPDPTVQLDVDRDTLEEVTPDSPTPAVSRPAAAGNVITIPNVPGVQYRIDGVNATNGQTFTATGTAKVVTAVARTGKELTTGATASWSYTAV